MTSSIVTIPACFTILIYDDKHMVVCPQKGGQGMTQPLVLVDVKYLFIHQLACGIGIFVAKRK